MERVEWRPWDVLNTLSREASEGFRELWPARWCLAVNKTRPPLPGPPPRFPPEASAPRALFAVFAKYSSRIFYLFEEALRGSFEMANSGAPRHEQVL